MVLTSPPAPQPSRPGEEEDGAVDVYEETHVHGVYEAIASHFSATRHKPWPLVSSFLAGQAPGSVGLDVGCGNGKNMGVNRDVVMLGCDRSAALVALARDLWCGGGGRRCDTTTATAAVCLGDDQKEEEEQQQQQQQKKKKKTEAAAGATDGNGSSTGVIQGADVAVADSLVLPFREASADFAICIAVIHHLSTRERRVDAIRQLLRCIRRGGGGGGGGKILVYVWALEQGSSRRGWDEGGEQDLLVPWVMKAPPQKKDKKKKQQQQKQQQPKPKGQKQGGKGHEHGQGQGQVVQQANSRHETAENSSLEHSPNAAGTNSSSSISSSSDIPRADQPDGGEGGEKLQENQQQQQQQQQQGQHQHQLATQQQQQQQQQQQEERHRSEADADAAATAAAGTAGNDGDSSKQQGDRHADKTFHRYYHLYRKGELEEEVISAGGRVIDSGYERDNWWVIAG